MNHEHFSEHENEHELVLKAGKKIKLHTKLKESAYEIKLSEIEKKLREVFKLGYGDTIHLTINGEPYTIIEDREHD